MKTYQGQRLVSPRIRVMIRENEHTRFLVETTSRQEIASAIVRDACNDPAAGAALAQVFAQEGLDRFDLDLPWTATGCGGASLSLEGKL